jgi:hypothetical protein
LEECFRPCQVPDLLRPRGRRSPSAGIHYGDICTQGLFCGLVPGSTGDRNLADFSSLTVDPSTGRLLAVFPGDPSNRPDLPKGKNDFSSSVYVASQTGGPRFS